MKFAPALRWRAFFFVGVIASILAPSLLAQPGYRPQPDIVQTGKPDQEEGKRILETFRGLGIPGSFYLEFQLRVMPRRGDEKLVNGRLWGSSNASGPVLRIGLTTDNGEYRLLIQDGPDSALWQRSPTSVGAAEKVGVAMLFAPLAGTDLTAFDLQRPYLAWKDFVYEGVTRVRGRPAYKFLLYPPAEITAGYPALTGVRVYLDTAYRAMMQSEQIGKDGAVLKSMSLEELKKIGEQWILKSVDWRDETTRNKTRLTVTGAALNQDFVGNLFSPESLSDAIRPLPPQAITRVTPEE